MKNKLLLLALSLSLLTACAPRTTTRDPLELKVACPAGAPALALANYLNDENVEVNADASAVLSYLSPTSDKDVVIAPTNALAAKVMKAGAPYKIAATITFGNLYLLSLNTGIALTSDAYVVTFQKNSLPDKLLNCVYRNLNLTTHDVGSAANAEVAARTGVDETNNNTPVDYVLLSEPSVSRALKANPNAEIYSNLQALYSEQTYGSLFTQASIFVRNSTEKSKIDAFLSQIEDDIKEVTEHSETILKKGISDEQFEGKFLCEKDLIESVIKNDSDKNNKIGLGYKKAIDIKQSIDDFLASLGFVAAGSTSSEKDYYI